MELDRCQDLRDHFPVFVTDAIDPTLDARIREHLQLGCASCAMEIDRLDAAFYSVPRWLAPAPLEEGRVQAMVATIARLPQEQPEVPILFPDGRPLRLAWTLSFLMALALLGAAFWGRGQQRAVEQAEAAASAATQQSRQSRAEYRDLKQAHRNARAMLDQLSAPSTRVVTLRGPAGEARAFVPAKGGTLLLTVPALPAGAAYTLALVQGEAVHDLGAIEPPIADKGGGRQFSLPDGVDSGRLELRGGGEVVLSGELPAP